MASVGLCCYAVEVRASRILGTFLQNEEAHTSN